MYFNVKKKPKYPARVLKCLKCGMEVVMEVCDGPSGKRYELEKEHGRCKCGGKLRRK